MDKDHLPLLEDQNPLRRSEIFAGTRSETLALTEAIKACQMSQGVKRTSQLTRIMRSLFSKHTVDKCCNPALTAGCLEVHLNVK